MHNPALLLPVRLRNAALRQKRPSHIYRSNTDSSAVETDPAALPDAASATLLHFLFGCILLRLQTLNENLRRTRDVIAAKQLRSRAIASDHGVEDRDVLAQDGLRI